MLIEQFYSKLRPVQRAIYDRRTKLMQETPDDQEPPFQGDEAERINILFFHPESLTSYTVAEVRAEAGGMVVILEEIEGLDSGESSNSEVSSDGLQRPDESTVGS